MPRYRVLAGLALILAGCSALPAREPEPESKPTEPPGQLLAVELTNLGAAPELTNEVWLNTDAPLRLADLRGKVVLLDMWTFG